MGLVCDHEYIMGLHIMIINLIIKLNIITTKTPTVCSVLFGGVAAVVDVTAGGWSYARQTSEAHGVPYLRLQTSNYQWMAATDQLLQSRNATDAALIFASETR